MNKVFKHINALILCTMIIVPVYGMEEEAWYKKRSVRIGAAVTGIAATSAVAIWTGKIVIPVLFAGLFVKAMYDAPMVNTEGSNSDDIVNNNISVENVEEQKETDTCEQLSVVDQEVNDSYVVTHVVDNNFAPETEQESLLKRFWDSIIDAARRTTSQDLQAQI